MARVELTEENYDLLKKSASKRGISMSNLANSILEQVGLVDRDEKVILTIPKELTRRNKEVFREWLRVRLDALVDNFYPDKQKREVREDAIEFKAD